MNVADLRREYTKDSLRRRHLDENPFVQFERWMQQATEAKILDPNAMSLATVDAAGCPFLRTVLLKGYDESGFLFFTNYESRKALQIAENAHVALLFPWLELERQVIINGTAVKTSSEISQQYFQSRPRGSQIGAWASPQSETIESREVLETKWSEIDKQYPEGNLPLPPFWGGYRVIPETIEYWQGGANRIHDRFVYRQKESGNWHLQRLAP